MPRKHPMETVAGQSLIVETGIFVWPWRTSLGLAIISGACGGGGGGGGAVCIQGLNVYGAGGGGGGGGGQVTTLRVRKRTYQASGGSGGGGGDGGSLVDGKPSEVNCGDGCHFGNGGSGGRGAVATPRPDGTVSSGGSGGRGFPGETLVLELVDLSIGEQLKIEIGQGGGGGSGGEGFENGESGSAGSNGFVRFVPVYEGGTDT